MIWDEIVDQTITGPFKVDERFNLDSANYFDLYVNYSDFMDKNSSEWYKT